MQIRICAVMQVEFRGIPVFAQLRICTIPLSRDRSPTFGLVLGAARRGHPRDAGDRGPVKGAIAPQACP